MLCCDVMCRIDLMLGGDLKVHLNRDGNFTEVRSKFYAAEILLGLEHMALNTALSKKKKKGRKRKEKRREERKKEESSGRIHQNGILYRDIKLENVLLDAKGHCKISDLGLAVRIRNKKAPIGNERRMRGYAGTPGYTAPEVCHNMLYGFSADYFSYGVMVYRFLSGKKPFAAKKTRRDRKRRGKGRGHDDGRKPYPLYDTLASPFFSFPFFFFSFKNAGGEGDEKRGGEKWLNRMQC